MLTHGITFGGHPVSCAVALKNLEIMERDGIVTGAADARARSAPSSQRCSSSTSSATSGARATCGRSSS